MTNTYRASWTALVDRYEWPEPEDSRFAEKMAQGWDEIRRIMLEYIAAWMEAVHVHAVYLDATLAARAGVEWWKEDGA